jgi:hypothetical protein
MIEEHTGSISPDIILLHVPVYKAMLDFQLECNSHLPETMKEHVNTGASVLAKLFLLDIMATAQNFGAVNENEIIEAVKLAWEDAKTNLTVSQQPSTSTRQ